MPRSIRCGLNEFFADIADFNIRLKELGMLLKDSPHRVMADEVNRRDSGSLSGAPR